MSLKNLQEAYVSTSACDGSSKDYINPFSHGTLEKLGSRDGRLPCLTLLSTLAAELKPEAWTQTPSPPLGHADANEKGEGNASPKYHHPLNSPTGTGRWKRPFCPWREPDAQSEGWKATGLFNKYEFSTHHIPGTGFNAGNTVVNGRVGSASCHMTHFLVTVQEGQA